MFNVLMLSDKEGAGLFMVVLPIILAMIIIWFIHIPKAGFFLSFFLNFGFFAVVALCEIFPAFGRSLNRLSSMENAVVMAEFPTACIVGMVACVIMNKINNLTQAAEKKDVGAE